jgi:cellulose synthase/poly-beta-1,6-N-acetylglucosamine synthase-like glycosyltransferase
MIESPLPLVSLVVLVYNQQSYVGEAVKAALAQSYPRLEILISDDGSTDGSVDVVKKILSRYKGPHQTSLNVNQRNLGIGEHINRLFELAKGELVILAAGDDVSLPGRVSRTVARWIDSDERPSAVYCRAQAIDAAGRNHGRFATALDTLEPRADCLIGYKALAPLLLLGACAAYTPEVIRHFGPLKRKLGVEDIPLTVRASLLGGVATIDEALVQYRVNVSVWLPRKLTGEDFDRHSKRLRHRIQANYWVSRQILADVHSTNDQLAKQAAKRRHTAAVFALYTSKRHRFALGYYISAAKRSGHWRPALWPGVLLGLPRLHRFLFWLKTLLHRGTHA